MMDCYYCETMSITIVSSYTPPEKTIRLYRLGSYRRTRLARNERTAQRAGVEVRQGTPAEARARGVVDLLLFKDPAAIFRESFMDRSWRSTLIPVASPYLCFVAGAGVRPYGRGDGRFGAQHSLLSRRLGDGKSAISWRWSVRRATASASPFSTVTLAIIRSVLRLAEPAEAAEIIHAPGKSVDDVRRHFLLMSDQGIPISRD